MTIFGKVSRVALGWWMALTALGLEAHTVWLEQDTQEKTTYHVRFGGHAGKLEPLEPNKLQTVDVFDVSGERLGFERADSASDSKLSLPSEAALVALYYDNGIWTKNPMGESVNKPLNQMPGATEATRAVKYHKTALQWSEQMLRPIGQVFEVVPLEASQPEAVKPFKIRVLLQGKPAADVQIGRGENGDLATTDAQGVATFIPDAGFNKLWAGKRFTVKNEGYSELSYEYLFGFTAANP